MKLSKYPLNFLILIEKELCKIIDKVKSCDLDKILLF